MMETKNYITGTESKINIQIFKNIIYFINKNRNFGV